MTDQRSSSLRRLFVAVGALLFLTSCRVDVSTSIAVNADGSGEIVVTAVADAELVDAAPGLADELRTDDLTAAGWTVDGPTATDDGGLRVELRHDFAGPDEATDLLGQINAKRGPYRGITVTRTVGDDEVTIAVSGELGVGGGLQAFTDASLTELVGDVPWADEVESRGLTLADVLGADLVVAVPDAGGDTPPVTLDDDGEPADGVERFVLTPGGAVPVDARTVIDLTPRQRSPFLAGVAGVALVGWLVVSIGFAVYVVRARRRRHTAHLRRLGR